MFNHPIKMVSSNLFFLCKTEIIVNYLSRRHRGFYETVMDVKAAFAIDIPYEYPVYDEPLIKRILDEDIGNYIGVSYSWDRSSSIQANAPYFGNHLKLWRDRNIG